MLTGVCPEMGMVSGGALKQPSLQYWSMNNNFITGPLPNTIGNMNQLFEFYVDSNYFSGTIPVEIGSSLVLQNIDMSSNLLSGSFPSTISQLTFLELFFVQNNELTGNLNSFVDAASQPVLVNIDVSNNQFTGLHKLLFF